jgi:diguanylate cyclase (GGDEF)-like protein
MNETEPIAFLTERLAAAERERDALERKAERLEAIQAHFVLISSALDETAIAHAALRAVWFALGFTRAMWFAVDENGAANALFDLDGGTEPLESLYGDAFPDGSRLVRCARGESDAGTGLADDPDAPIFDGRGWYALAAVTLSSGVAAVLYADGSRERAIESWAVEALRKIAAQAALTLENVRLRAELERLALRDPLTGLPNRRALVDRLAIEIARTQRSGSSLGFAMIDVDDFKKINDSRGHAGGDEALKTFARLLTETVRSTDVPARFAGDEFALIMPDTDRASAAPVMERFYAALRTVGLSCSTGIAFIPTDAPDERLLFEAADAAVYVAKRAGKNTYRFARKPV